ncbi:MAG: GNAT family N-acetyltransferase [Anaerolineaceae bacterium]
MELDPNLNIRIFIESDADLVSRLIIDNLIQVNVQDYGKAAVRQLARQYTPDHIRKYALKGEMYVGEVPLEGSLQVVGTVTLEGERLRNMFVRVDVHGQGIGKRLMGFVENLAIHNGLTRLTLQADLSAAEFYEKLGFIRVGEKVLLIRSARIKMVAMEKEL